MKFSFYFNSNRKHIRVTIAKVALTIKLLFALGRIRGRIKLGVIAAFFHFSEFFGGSVREYHRKSEDNPRLAEDYQRISCDIRGNLDKIEEK